MPPPHGVNRAKYYTILCYFKLKHRGDLYILIMHSNSNRHLATIFSSLQFSWYKHNTKLAEQAVSKEEPHRRSAVLVSVLCYFITCWNESKQLLITLKRCMILCLPISAAFSHNINIIMPRGHKSWLHRGPARWESNCGHWGEELGPLQHLWFSSLLP